MTLSVYEIICDAIGDGVRLPAGFELPHEQVATGELRFMIGARDGIGVYHGGGSMRVSQQDANEAVVEIHGATKGDLIGALRRDHLEPEVFSAVSLLMDALADEGPVPGFSEYEHTAEALVLFAKHAESQAETLAHLRQILNLRDAVREMDLDGKDDLLGQFDQVLALARWQPLIESEAGDLEGDLFHTAGVARRMGVDIQAQLLTALKADPIRHGWYIAEAFGDPGAAEELVGLYEKVLPLAEMASGMGDYLFSPTYGEEYGCLDQLLQALRGYPLLGEALVRAGLESPVVHDRNLACSTLAAWSEQLSQPVKDFSPALHETASQVLACEVNEQVRERLAGLLTSA